MRVAAKQFFGQRSRPKKLHTARPFCSKLQTKVIEPNMTWSTSSPPLPFVPRRMSDRLAAIYCGVSVSMFRELVSKGDIAKPKRIGRNVGWDKDDLDSYLDNLPREDEPSNSDWLGQAL